MIVREFLQDIVLAMCYMRQNTDDMISSLNIVNFTIIIGCGASTYKLDLSYYNWYIITTNKIDHSITYGLLIYYTPALSLHEEE